ncbi:MAG: acyl--CoA ligase, partial [Eggerthellaceae bacterium]|nr:acyl--CoA ligase [Eggerthellaceae bacterium]
MAMENTLYSYFEQACDRFGDHVAIVDGERRLTYEELKDRVHRLASNLFEIGIKPDVRVAIMLSNSLEFSELFYALLLLKAVPVPLNCRLHTTELLEQISISSPEFLFYDADHEKQIEEVKSELTSSIRVIAPSDESAGETSLESLLAGGNAAFEEITDVLPEDEGLILFTGGSTGFPKAVVMTQRALFEKERIFLEGEGAYTENDSFLLFSPLYHQGGLSFLIFLLSAGSKVVLQKSMRASYIVETILAENITQMLLLPPSLCHRIRDYMQDMAAMSFPSVECVTLTGG